LKTLLLLSAKAAIIFGMPAIERKGPLTLLLAALAALVALSIDMSLPAMLELQRVFSADAPAVQLTLSLFLLGFALGQVICGPLSDRLGRRPVLIAGLIVFAGAGIGCAFSPNLTLLVGLRFIQGLGACVGPVIARAIVRDRFDAKESASVLSQITQVMIVAPIIAPTLGGLLLGAFGWSSIFLTLGGCGVAILAVSGLALPETLPPRTDAETPAPVWRNFATVLAHRTSLRHTLAVALSYGGMFAYISGSPLVLMDVFGISEQRFGIFFAATAVSVMIGASVNRFLIKRKRQPSQMLTAGAYLIMSAASILVALALLKIGGLFGVILPMCVYMFGLGLLQPNATAAAMAPHGRLAGVSSSLIGFLQTACAALTGWLVSAFYDHSPASLAVTVALMAALTFAVFVRDGRIEGIHETNADLVPELPVVVDVKR
jgi:MFS transporter, DHA1 family, multidrug resistance protein